MREEPLNAIPAGAARLRTADLRRTQLRLLQALTAAAPFQPATNLWRCIELPQLAMALPATGRGLDVGCGDGIVTALLRDLVGGRWCMVGLDPDPAEATLARATGLYDRVHTSEADRIPEPDEIFDFVLSNSVLEHIPSLPATLADIARCLKPGGHFAATVPSPYFHACLVGPDWTRRIPRSAYLQEVDARLAHVNYWSPHRWQEELRATGLELISIAWYLSRTQVRRWELLTNWTGGLLYRLRGKRQAPIIIQRNLDLRRRAGSAWKAVAPLAARLIGWRVLGADPSGSMQDHAGLLIQAMKR